MSLRNPSPVARIPGPRLGSIPSILRDTRILREILVAISLVVSLAMIISPVFAETPPPGHFGNFAQGIPVYWPYHAFFMGAGVLLLLAGAIIAALHRPVRWHERHIILEVAGSAFVLVGLATGVWMVMLSGLPQFRNSHAVLGAIIVVLLALIIIFGLSIQRVKGPKQGLRLAHLWLGRIVLVLLLVNIVLGVQFLLLLLPR